MPYIGRTLGQGTRSRFLYTATAGQTTFSGSDSQSNTLSYADNNGLDCFQNGVLLKGGGADYTATTGTSVVLTTGASVSDVIEILVYDVFAIADHVKKSGDAMTGALTNIDVNGTELVLDADGDTSITADTDDQVDIKIGGSDAMHIKATASHGTGLGIGTSAPLRQLHIENTSANSEIAFTAGTSGVSSILFGDGQTGTDVYRGYLQYNHSTDKMLFGTSSNERMGLNSVGSLNVVAVYNDTTSGAANVNVVSDGHLRRSTSSRKYKNTINDATHGLTELLNLRSVTYKGNNDGDTIFGGLIAEEVHDAGLTEFVQYDDDGEPDALAYGNMVSLCIKAIQELKTELDNAKARITALEGN